MSTKRRSTSSGRPSDRKGWVRAAAPEPASTRRTPIVLLVVILVLAAAVVLGSDYVFGLVTGSGDASGSHPAATATAPSNAGSTQLGTTAPGVGSTWTNVNPAQLVAMLKSKDFTLINVKTPYMGEIDGTDLYIPYDQVKAKASELPADKNAKVLVYCRSGVESAQAAQSLLELGYTNVWNLDGGMNAWTAAGGTLVQKHR